jgi:hypothetical protein
MSNPISVGKYFDKEDSTWKDMVGCKFGRLTVVRFAGRRYYRDGSYRSVWECMCDCGNPEPVQRIQSSLTQKQTVSCGCWSSEKQSIRCRKSGTAFRDLWFSYKKGARNRGLEWTITEEQFKEITSAPCYYTGRPPVQEARSSAGNKNLKFTHNIQPYEVYLYNGIDRLDNTKGYTVENCVACCEEANFAKCTMTQNAFISLCKEVAQQHQ